MKNILAIILTVITINVNAQHLTFEGLELGCDFKTLDNHANKSKWEYVGYDGSTVKYVGEFLSNTVIFLFNVEDNVVADSVEMMDWSEYAINTFNNVIRHCLRNGKEINHTTKTTPSETKTYSIDEYTFLMDDGYEWKVSYRDVHRNIRPFTLITIQKH